MYNVIFFLPITWIILYIFPKGCLKFYLQILEFLKFVMNTQKTCFYLTGPNKKNG